jgi:hypothetical protein
MSNHDNHRREDVKRTENGPRWKTTGNYPNPPQVARARRSWKRLLARKERHAGGLCNPFWVGRPRRPDGGGE